ncbi:hypothetical protein ACFL4V_00835 [Candidatus Latescibacterota bacterium]
MRTWHVTGLLGNIEIFSKGIPGTLWDMKLLLRRYKDYRIKAVYEAGYFRYWLYDELTAGIPRIADWLDSREIPISYFT